MEEESEKVLANSKDNSEEPCCSKNVGVQRQTPNNAKEQYELQANAEEHDDGKQNDKEHCDSDENAKEQCERKKNAESERQEEEDLLNMVTAEEYLMCKDVVLLGYEKQMFLDMVHADALMVCAKGLSYERVLLNILKAYSDAGNMILVINSSDWEEEYYKSRLDKKYIHEVANTATERERVYLEGGIQFITTRILVVDLLKQRIPVELITGIVVLRAHTIIESCQEAFALRLYRQRNKTGFIKAFSSNAESFTIGYGHIERIMRNLFVKDLFIWPRFHATVQASLKPYEAQTIELHVPLTQKMKHMQAHILDIMNYLVREIKRINRTVDMDEITAENCVTKKFHKILQAQLDCIWHQLNSQTKLIVADLKILRNLMISTMYNDAVSSYALIKRYRTTEYALSNSGWTLLDSAEQIFKLSKERVYNSEGEFEPEACPKWKYLSEILKVEIPADMKQAKPLSYDPPKVLILCQDRRTCFQLKQFLTQSGERYLLYTAMRHEIPIGKLSKSFGNVQEIKDSQLIISQKTPNQNTTVKSKLFANNKDSAADSEEAPPGTQMDELTRLLTQNDMEDIEANYFQESYMLTMTQNHLDESNMSSLCDSGTTTDDSVDNPVFEPFPELENLDITATIAARKQPLICLQTFKSDKEGSMVLDRMLEEIMPQYVVMYHCNVTAIRQLEIYEARQRRAAKERMKVFFLIHAKTVEEQSYLTSLRREKQAFELIIQTKSTMVIPEYQDGKTDEAFVLYKNFKHADEAGNNSNAQSRKAGGQELSKMAEEEMTPKIIVDMREFRSDLPCLIHKRGIEVLPVTITIGDYILTPEICVERKSISDLIGSLNSGRLYNQCIQMQRYYAKPILLIEFDQNKPFHLQGKYMLSQNTTATNADITQKLQLLTLHFPKLRIIWSPSPYATAQLFEELKMGKPEPNVKEASALGADDTGAYDNLKFNSNVYDFLLRLPGVNTKNIHKIMRHGGSLKEMLKKSQAELSILLDSQENGKLLWDILHVAHLPEKDEVLGSAAMLVAGKQMGSHSRFRRGALASASGRGASNLLRFKN